MDESTNQRIELLDEILATEEVIDATVDAILESGDLDEPTVARIATVQLEEVGG